MEYRTDYLAKIAADPGCHPGFANYREDFEEEAKDGQDEHGRLAETHSRKD